MSTEANETVKTVTLHDARIPRRGKGAKGSIECQTIGVPEIDKETGIAIKFDYSHVTDIPMQAFLDFCEKSGFSAQHAMSKGLDAILMRASIRAQNAKSLLRARLMKELELDKREAEKLAIAFTGLIDNLKKSGYEKEDIPTFDELIEKKRKQLKAKAEAEKK